MATRTIPAQTVPGDSVTRFSPTRTVPDGTYDVEITLTEGSGTPWVNQGPGTFWWGVQRSEDNGATWIPLVTNEPDGTPIGWTHPRTGAMPMLGVSASALESKTGQLVRMFFRCTAPCRVGAAIVTNRVA